MTPAIDSNILVDENSKSKAMESLEPLTPKAQIGPPQKKMKNEKGKNDLLILL
jgi:hypothetical protein